MPPKNAPSNPLGDIVEIVTETKRSRRGLRSTEKEVPVRSLNDNKSGQPSRSKSHSRKRTAVKPAHTSGHISSDGETIPLRHKPVQEDIPEDKGDHDEVAMNAHDDGEEHAATQNTYGQGNV